MKYFQKRKKLIPLGIFIFLYLLVLIPLIVFNLQQRQESRGRASAPQPGETTQLAATCGNTPADIALILDRSGSMQGQKITDAKNAAKLFVDIIAQQNNGTRISFISYSSSATIDSGLTTNYATVKTAIDKVSANNETCIQCGVNKALAAFTQNPGTVKKVTILLTDGKANYVNGSSVSQTTAETATLNEIKNGAKMPYFTIGLGSDVNAAFLQSIANTTGAKYYFPPTPAALNEIYADISTLYGKGSVTGFVYHDQNDNGTFDTNEPKLQGWTVTIKQDGFTNTQSTTTDTYGNYYFGGLCDGTHKITETVQTGFRQTEPANNEPHTILIDKANAVTGKNFGNSNTPPTPTPTYPPTPTPTRTPTPMPTYTPTPTYIPTPTPTYKPTPTPTYIPTPTPTYKPTAYPTQYPTAYPTQGLTSFTLTAFQHGIGNSGDNSNPSGSSLSNKDPKHKTVAAELQLFDVNNKMIGEGTGQVVYNEKDGNYSGVISITPNQFTTGKYTLKVKTDRHLRRLMPGIQTIVAGQHNDTLPAITLVAGDIDNNNALNILDYNALLDCYSDLATASNCEQPGKKEASDINDDGPVNQIDYNLFLREIATQPGE